MRNLDEAPAGVMGRPLSSWRSALAQLAGQWAGRWGRGGNSGGQCFWPGGRACWGRWERGRPGLGTDSVPEDRPLSLGPSVG